MSAELSSGKGNWSIAEINSNFKPTFENRSKTMYSSANALEGTIKKKFNFTGTDKKFETHLSYAGGYGARKLPKANNSLMANQVIEAKKVFQRALCDREGIKAASNSQGSYQQYLKFPIKKAVENYVNQCGRICFGDGTGILGVGDALTNVTGLGTLASPFIVAIGNFDDAVWEEKAYVQVVSTLALDNSGGTPEGGADSVVNLLEVVAVDEVLGRISLVGVSPVLTARVAAPGPLAITVGFAHQRSYNGEPTGLEKVLMATTGSNLYGIPVQRRWQATQIDADGSGLLVDMVNEAFLKTDHRFGESPDAIFCRFNQYQKLLAQLEDKKTVMVTNKNLKGHIGFEGIEYVSSTGKKCTIMTNRFAKKDKVYLLNMKYIERHHRPDFGWFDEDGTVFMRETDEDQYEARYGGYWENLMVPTAHAVIYNLSE